MLDSFKIIFRNWFRRQTFCRAYNWRKQSMIEEVRKRPQIGVVFFIASLSAWKTETLYVAMTKNKRFRPTIAIISAPEGDERKQIEKYVKERGYNYLKLEEDEGLGKDVAADIIFFQKPYDNFYYHNQSYLNYPDSLFCYANYAFHTINERWTVNTNMMNIAWQIYYENDFLIEETRKLMDNKASNCIKTGLPFTDELLQTETNVENPWKLQRDAVEKKKIIWAPHHSIREQDGLQNGTFLQVCDFMLEMAQKYADKIQVAFKPHPLLRRNLNELWGVSKTDEYYDKWSRMENTQEETGKYIGLFLHSDAMIHDCSSFTLEYLYTNKPVLFIMKKDNSLLYNNFTKMGLEMHYRAYELEEIEQFIKNVIEGVDPMQEVRHDFVKNNLLPPNGVNASENIINSIIG